MTIYVYKDGLLLEEQQMRKYQGIQYMALQKKFFYSAQKELTKTESYGRYDSKMPLYSTEENIRAGNTLTKKSAVISNLESVIGYYNLSALHEMFRREQMDWAISLFDAKYLATAVFDGKSCTIEKYDDHGHIIESSFMHPENHAEVLAKMLYRNEYNDKDLPEFVISYRMADDGKMEETDIKKFYYHS
jgi:hypothetical protein